MVVVRVRETYDLSTVTNKMTLIGIHTPSPNLIKANFPGLLMNCKYYRPLSADVAIACASMLPADPLQVGTTDGDIAPEDMFNPILYKACTNESYSLLESRILGMVVNNNGDVAGASADIETSSAAPSGTDEFACYYGLLSDAHGWRHANPQAGLQMTGLKPLVHEVLSNFVAFPGTDSNIRVPSDATNGVTISPVNMRGNAKPLPRMPCTGFTSAGLASSATTGFGTQTGIPGNSQPSVAEFKTMVGCIIIPPSRLHELYYRMTIVWNIEFTDIRTIQEITNWAGLEALDEYTYFRNYTFSSESSKLLTSSSEMADANVDLNKVM